VSIEGVLCSLREYENPAFIISAYITTCTKKQTQYPPLFAMGQAHSDTALPLRGGQRRHVAPKVASLTTHRAKRALAVVERTKKEIKERVEWSTARYDGGESPRFSMRSWTGMMYHFVAPANKEARRLVKKLTSLREDAAARATLVLHTMPSYGRILPMYVLRLAVLWSKVDLRAVADEVKPGEPRCRRDLSMPRMTAWGSGAAVEYFTPYGRNDVRESAAVWDRVIAHAEMDSDYGPFGAWKGHKKVFPNNIPLLTIVVDTPNCRDKAFNRKDGGAGFDRAMEMAMKCLVKAHQPSKGFRPKKEKK
jgi:hypothetical protein